MKSLEAKKQAEDALFKKAAQEIHNQGAAWFSMLDMAAQIAVENKRIRSERSLGSRALRFFGVDRTGSGLATTIDGEIYAIAGRLQNDGSLESRRRTEDLEAINPMYRLIEEPESTVA